MSHGYLRGLGITTAAVIAGACSSSKVTPHHTVHGCSPYVSDQCLLPFPNAWFEEPDATSPTRYRVVFPNGVLPSSVDGVPLSPTLLGRVDGFSAATPIIAWFPRGVDATQLSPSPTTPIDDRIPMSLSADSPIALVDVAARTRVPFFAELDANAKAGERQALIIHPAVRLKPATRYAVAVRTSLRDAQGASFAAEGQFAQWVNGTLPSTAALFEVSDRLDEDAAAFEALGISKSSLALAWDFDTASEASTTGQLISMRDQALAAAPKGLGFTVTSSEEPSEAEDPNILRLVKGTFQAPSFQAGPDPALLNYDASGQPVMGEPADWPFTVYIPRCVAQTSGPRPFVIAGHGLFATGEHELEKDSRILQTLCMVGIATDWIGVAKPDRSILLSKVVVDANNFNLITDRLQQAHVNFQVLTRLAKHALADDAHLTVQGHRTYDPTQGFYFGASNGGIQGATYLALSPDVDRGVLNVPGAAWSLMLWRSGDFSTGLFALEAAYPDKLDLQVVLALSQSLWDKTDPIQFAPRMMGQSKHVLFQESVGDAMVTNVATRLEMRTIGAKALGPLVQPVFGLTESAGPLDGLVYAQWSVDPQPVPPLTNVPAADNDAHGGVRDLPLAIEQMKQFLAPDGKAVNPCNGPCVFPRR